MGEEGSFALEKLRLYVWDKAVAGVVHIALATKDFLSCIAYHGRKKRLANPSSSDQACRGPIPPSARLQANVPDLRSQSPIPEGALPLR